jgi:hypothetical protein
MRLIVLMIAVVVSFSSCDSDPWQVDVSGVDLQVGFKNFDRDLMADTITDWAAFDTRLQQTYPKFYAQYMEQVMGLGMVGDPALGLALKGFVTDPYVNEWYDRVEQVYNDERRSGLQHQLQDGLKRAKVLLQIDPPKEVVVYISGLRSDVLIDETMLGVSLDRFLGADYERYQQVQDLQQYQVSRMDPAYLNSYLIQCWLLSTYAQNYEFSTLLDFMIVHGRVQYASSKLLPEVSAHWNHGYSPSQLKWCEENEFQVYAHFVEQELFYSKEEVKIQKYIGEGPFTSGFPRESPGGVGIWLGYKIVESYINHQDVSLAELMSKSDSQEIFEKSGYKPAL